MLRLLLGECLLQQQPPLPSPHQTARAGSNVEPYDAVPRGRSCKISHVGDWDQQDGAQRRALDAWAA